MDVLKWCGDHILLFLELCTFMMGRQVCRSVLGLSFRYVGSKNLISLQGSCGKHHLYLLIHQAHLCLYTHFVIFTLKSLSSDLCFRRNIFGPIATICTIKSLVYIFSEINSPQSTFSSFTLPATPPVHWVRHKECSQYFPSSTNELFISPLSRVSCCVSVELGPLGQCFLY